MGLKRTLARLLPSSTNRWRREALQLVEELLSPQRYEEINLTPGCLNDEQSAILLMLAYRASEAGAVVEIGSFMGRSTLWLASGLQHADRGQRRVIAIDPHDGHERPDVRPDLDAHDAFLHHIRQAGMEEWVDPRRQRSQEAASNWSEPISVLWIDGSHDYEDVAADLKGFAPHVIAGGHIALHDTRGRHFPGVRQAMLEYFSRHPTFCRVVDLRNMTVYEKQR